MNEKRMQALVEIGFNENWLKEVKENFEPKENGKYEIHIYDCEDLDQEPETGIFIASYFFDDERDLSIIHHFFEGLFYTMNVVETKEELGRGIVDGAPFEEMEEYEGVSWCWLDEDELGPDFEEREKERRDEIEKHNASLRADEEFLDNLIERNFNEIFFEYQTRKGIENGDIPPMAALELDGLKEKLKKLIQKVCY